MDSFDCPKFGFNKAFMKEGLDATFCSNAPCVCVCVSTNFSIDMYIGLVWTAFCCTFYKFSCLQDKLSAFKPCGTNHHVRPSVIPFLATISITFVKLVLVFQRAVAWSSPAPTTPRRRRNRTQPNDAARRRCPCDAILG